MSDERVSDERDPVPKRHHRIRNTFLVGVVAPIVIGAIVLWWGLSSGWAAERLIARGLAMAGETVQIGRVSGRLKGPLVLQDVRFKLPTVSGTIDSAVLEWSPTGLLEREVRVDRLHVRGIHLVLPDSVPKDTAAPKRPSLPVDVLLGDVRADDITVDAPGDVRIRGGTARMTGRAEDYRLVARGRFSAPWLRDTTPVSLTGRGNLEQLILDRASAELMKGHVTAWGRVNWFPQTGWSLAVRADTLQPGLLTENPAALPGRVSGFARTRGVIDSLGPRGVALLDSMSGALKGQPLRGDAAVRFASSRETGVRATIDRSDLGWGSASALTTGWVDTSRMSLAYRIAVGNLGTAVPGARGALALRGTAAGPLLAPRVRTTVRGRDIVYGTNRLAALEGRADVDLAPNGRTDVDLTGDRASVGAQAIDRVVLAMRGTQRRHTITGDVQVAEGGIDLAMQGGLPGGVQGQRWAGSLTRLDVSSRRAGDWRLQQAVPLRLAPTSASLGRLCLAGMVDARVCAQGAWQGGTTWQAQGAVERFPLARLDSLLPDTLRLAAAPTPADTTNLTPDERDQVRTDSILVASHELDGTLEARFDLRSVGGRLLGTAGAELRRAAFLYKREAGDSAFQRVAFDTATFALTAGGADGGVLGRLRVRALEGDSAGARQLGALAGTFHLPGYTRVGQVLERQAVTARVDGRLERLSVLQAFVPRLDSVRGAATLGMTVNGTVGLPRLDGELRLDSIAAWWPGGRAARGAVTATANTVVGPGRSLTATLAVVPRGVLYDYLLDTVPARVAVDSGGLELRVSPEQGLLARMALGLSNPGAQGNTGGTRVASLEGTLAMPTYRSLDQTLAAVPLSLEARGELPDLGFARILPLPVDSLGGRLRLDLAMEGTLAAPRVTGALRATDFAALLPQGSLVRGHVDGDLRASVGADSSLTADFRLAPREMLLEWGEGETRRQVAVDTAALVVTSTPGQGLRGALDLRLANALRYTPGVAAGSQEGVPVGVVTGRFALPGWWRLNQPMAPQSLTASLDGRIDDLAFVEAVAPQLDSLSGHLTLDARVTGTVERPSLAGGLRVVDGAARVGQLGIYVHDVQLAAQGDQAGEVSIDGRMRSGPGRLAIAGRSPLASTPERPGRIRIEGERFQAANTPEASALVSPRLDVVLAGDSTDVRGEVTIPEAHVELAEIPETAVSPSDDVVFVDDTAAQTAPPKFYADVRLALGDSVTFKGFNFTAEFGGAVRVVQRPEQAAVGSGTIVIEEGRFKAYGQDLTISQGLVRFAGGPVDDPGLAIRAQRVADDSVIAGLQIGGTVKNPRVTIFSTPSMSQNRALEYIVLGHPRGQGSPGQGNLMDKAVSSLGLSGSNAVARAVGQGLGLSEARIETEGGMHEASFVAGSYLSPHLYVSYGIGLFDAISRLRMRYEVSPRFTLQAERGEDMGADFLYSIEAGETGTPPRELPSGYEAPRREDDADASSTTP